MSAQDDDSARFEERLKSALWYSIGRIVDEENLKLGVNATPQFIGALTELVWTQIQTSGQDLETFAKHAGRSKINFDDVMLLTRRNEDLAGILKDFAAKKSTDRRERRPECSR